MTYFRAFGTIIGTQGLTSVFEMGTGMTPELWSPDRIARKWWQPRKNVSDSGSLGPVGHKEPKVVKPIGLLVLVSYTHYCAYTPSLSTW